VQLATCTTVHLYNIITISQFRSIKEFRGHVFSKVFLELSFIDYCNAGNKLQRYRQCSKLFKYEVIPDEDSLIWVCRYCTFWCEMFDPLIMERHLCVDFVAIPPGIRTSFRLFVRERLCAHIKELFEIDIE
jgi:hypothetical protein